MFSREHYRFGRLFVTFAKMFYIEQKKIFFFTMLEVATNFYHCNSKAVAVGIVALDSSLTIFNRHLFM